MPGWMGCARDNYLTCLATQLAKSKEEKQGKRVHLLTNFQYQTFEVLLKFENFYLNK